MLPRSHNRDESLGFTLIELQIVVVIIGLLAAMAIPAFSKIRETSLKLEGKSLASNIRKDIQEFYEYTGRLPRNNQECALPDPERIQGKHVSSIEVKEGVIYVEFKFKQGKQLASIQLTPVINPDNPTGPIRWE